MGLTYKAIDINLHCPVTLKVRAAARLSWPRENIAGVIPRTPR